MHIDMLSRYVIVVLLFWSEKIEVKHQVGTPRPQAEALTEVPYLY